MSSRAKAPHSRPPRLMPTTRRSGSIRQLHLACRRVVRHPPIFLLQFHLDLAATAEDLLHAVRSGVREDDVWSIRRANLFFFAYASASSDVPDVGGRPPLSSTPSVPTPAVLFRSMNKYNPSISFLRRAEPLSPLCSTTNPEHERCWRPLAHLHLRGRGAAGIGRQQLEVTLRRRYSRRRRLDRALCIIFLCHVPPADIKYGSPAVRCRLYRVRLVTTGRMFPTSNR